MNNVDERVPEGMLSGSESSMVVSSVWQGHGSDFKSFETCMISDQLFQYHSSISKISWYRSGHLTTFDI